jgi:hypothetical protein
MRVRRPWALPGQSSRLLSRHHHHPQLRWKPPPDAERLDICYMMSSEGMVHLEIDLDRAVMVSVTAGNRREISLDVAARAIYSQLDLPPYSFSIWAFEPADFLVLCDSIEVQDTLVLASSVSTATCSLSLAP